jgi:hypothetical protein
VEDECRDNVNEWGAVERLTDSTWHRDGSYSHQVVDGDLSVDQTLQTNLAGYHGILPSCPAVQ